MQETNPGFEAFLSHPDFDDAMVGGRIVFDHWNLMFQAEGTSAQIPIARVVVALGKGKEEQICFSDPQQPGVKIYTTDWDVFNSASLAHSNHVRGQLESILGRREIWRRVRIVAYVLVFCIAITWLGSLAVGAMARVIADRVPSKWAEDTDAEVLTELQDYGMLKTNSTAVAEMTTLATSLAGALSSRDWSLKICVMTYPFPNAFALPGGHIVVTSGLLEMVDSPEELLGVLAHELAHITQKHHIRGKIASAGPFVIFSVFLRSDSGAIGTLTRGSGMLIEMGFSKEYEIEADDTGWEYLIAANIDPRGMIRVFRKLKAKEEEQKFGIDIPQAFRSHPAIETRIARLESKWNKLPQKTGFLTLTNQIPKSDSMAVPAELLLLR